MLTVVVLPAPLGPRTPYTEPVGTARSTPSTARFEPNCLTSPRASMASSDPRGFDALVVAVVVVVVVMASSLYYATVVGLTSSVMRWRRWFSASDLRCRNLRWPAMAAEVTPRMRSASSRGEALSPGRLRNV